MPAIARMQLLTDRASAPWTYGALIHALKDEELLPEDLSTFKATALINRALLRGLVDWDKIAPPAAVDLRPTSGQELWLASPRLAGWAAPLPNALWTRSTWWPHQLRQAAIRLQPFIDAASPISITYACDYSPTAHRTMHHIRALLVRMIQVRICWSRFTFEGRKVWPPGGLEEWLFADVQRLERARFLARKLSAKVRREVESLLTFRFAGLTAAHVEQLGTGRLDELPPDRLSKLAVCV